jgi:hypothetical protein
MGKKSAFNAAKTSASIFGLFFKDVVPEIGLDKALAIHAGNGKLFGAAWASMLKGELGRRKLNLAAWQRVFTKTTGEIGSTPKFEKRRSVLTARILDCPFYAGCIEAGLDHKTVESMCSQRVALEYEEMKKEYPGFSGCLKFRATPDEPCVEEFVVTK